MKKLIAMTLVLFVSGAFAEGSSRVVGESLDSGLGSLSTTYNAGEYNYKKNADGTVVWPFAI